MLKHLVNLAKGEVTGRVESGFPERVLNICAEYGIVFWDLRWASPVEFTFTMTRRDWKRLRRLSRRIDCDMTAVNWKGAPFFLGRIRRRYGLWVTLGACVALLFWGSFFIWDFEIEGNVNVSRQEILRALEKHGVGFGTYGLDVDSPELRNYILLDLPELSYIAVNVRGCRAYVQVLPGTTVKAGQLLISGVVQGDVAGVRYLRGMGKVYGRTWYRLRCRVPLTAAEKSYTGEEKVRRALLVGKKRINLYIGSSILGDTCDKISSWDKWELPGGVALPVTVVTERLRPYAVTERRRSREEALALAETVLDQRLAGYLDEGEVLSREISAEERDGCLVVTLSAECREQIGRFIDAP